MKNESLRVVFIGFGNVAQRLAALLTEERGNHPGLAGLDLRAVAVFTRGHGALLDAKGIGLEKVLTQFRASGAFPAAQVTALQALETMDYDVLVELSEDVRAQLIRDRNNQEFVDRMYMTYLLDTGLVAPRPTRRLPSIDATDGKFAERVGTSVDTSDDRLWRLPPDAPEWSILSGRVWYRGLVSEAAMQQSQQMAAEIGAVRQEIQAELSTRRWP